MIFSITAVVVYCAVSAIAHQPEVTTTLGTIKGSAIKSLSGQKIHAFQGVPYAKPPIGKHRFKQSVPATQWAGVLNATRIPNMCMQLPENWRFPNSPIDVLGSEDCLYLNIYTPKLPSELPDGKLLDVLVYIHGGAFQILSGDEFGPEYIADKDVVYVSINYRMGVLGFLSLDDRTCPGNNGLKDQTLALKWINKHISAFGGNPNSITISGTSAGGASVHYHLLSPLSKGLFHKAIAHSGVALNPWAVTKKPKEKALILSEAVGCPTNDSILILECLRDRPAESLVASTQILKIWADLPISVMGPVIENPHANAFIDQQPIDIIKSKTINDVPVIFSYTSDEGSYFALNLIKEQSKAQELEERWSELLPVVLDYIEVVDPSKFEELAQTLGNHYNMGNGKITDGLTGFIKSVGERNFDVGIQQAAILHAENQASPVYSYKFSYKGDASINPLKLEIANVSYEGGAPHGFDSIFLYKPVFLPPIYDSPESLAMTKTMTDYLINFIRETPVTSWSTVKSGLPDWKFLDIEVSDSAKNVFKTEKLTSLEFWNSLNFQENSLSNTVPMQISEKSEVCIGETITKLCLKYQTLRVRYLEFISDENSWSVPRESIYDNPEDSKSHVSSLG